MSYWTKKVIALKAVQASVQIEVFLSYMRLEIATSLNCIDEIADY